MTDQLNLIDLIQNLKKVLLYIKGSQQLMTPFFIHVKHV